MKKRVVRKPSSPRKTAPRRKPSPAVRQLALVESGYECGNPTAGLCSPSSFTTLNG